MNVLWISHNVPYPPQMGVLLRNYNLLKQLSRIADVYLVALCQRDILPVRVDLAEARRELEKFCRHVEIVPLPSDASRLRWYGLVLGSVITAHPYSVNWVKCRQLQSTIRELVRRVRFEVAHFDTIGLAEYRDDVGDVPRVLNHHNIESQLMDRRRGVARNALERFYFAMEARKLRRYETEHCGAFDLNITVSELDKTLLSMMVPGSRIEVISNGVDTAYFTPGEEEIVSGNLVFVGGMNWYPNRDAILYFCREIWPLLGQEVPGASFTVVGGAPPRELLDLARRDPRVLVAGFVEDVRPYLRQAEVYVCPMRDGGGTRLKILDALAMGKAIVSTTIGCEGIDIQPSKNVLLADTPRDFVDRVKTVLADPQLRHRLGDEGRRLAETSYSWAIIGQRLNDLYRDLGRRRKPSRDPRRTGVEA
jgi:sugar transferase (PEP-CTERM/EpsH1 system associated)